MKLNTPRTRGSTQLPALDPKLPWDDGPDPLVGANVGSFRIVRPLGTGGMGSVYLAEHPVIGNKVAIKFLHESLAQDPDTVWRFYQEARAAHVVGHENIVSVYDLNLLPPKRYYIVMEYLDGETLAQRLRRGPMPMDASLHVLLQLCDALQCAHEAGVIHRDLKPENIFLVHRRGQKDFVKLVDFGIAKLRDSGKSSSVTRAGMVIGTPDYMSPEQCEGKPVDARSDLYALGVIAYRLATGRLPYEGLSVPQTLLAQLQEPAPRPRRFNADLDPRWEQAILRALSKSPEDRFQSMRAFASAAREVLENFRQKAMPQPARVNDRALEDAPTAVSSAPPALEVEVTAGDGPGVRMRGLHLSRTAVFVCSEGELPPLFSRVRIALAGRRGRLELDAEVVRHVRAAEAGSFGGVTGYALQFIGAERLTPELEALAGKLAPEATGDPALDHLLAKYRAQATHYDVLGLPFDAEFADVSARGNCVRRELDEAIQGRRLTPAQEAEAARTRERIDAAIATLTSLEKRVAYDGDLGNFPGIARALAAGLPSLRVDELHVRFRRAHPQIEVKVQQHIARVRLARALGNLDAVTAEYEQALRLDPLNRMLHEEWAASRVR